jgi:hypothetical protein
LSTFVASNPSLDAYWRAIVLFGRNSASYKFALAGSLLELAGRGRTLVTLEDLAEPYSRRLVEHVGAADRQGTIGSSRFLDACRGFNEGRLSRDELLSATARLGFANVIDAFHVVNVAEIPVRFFTDERRARRGMGLTDDLRRLAEGYQARLPQEVEARWHLVETAWQVGVSPGLLRVRNAPDLDTLVIETGDPRRPAVTSCRDALNGYQKGRCLYCFSEISVDAGLGLTADVDHFFRRGTGHRDDVFKYRGPSGNVKLRVPGPPTRLRRPLVSRGQKAWGLTRDRLRR